MFVAKLSPIVAGTTFKSGKVATKDTYILDVISGTCPKNRFMDPVITNNQGMVEGKAYLMEYSPGDDPEHPNSFNFKMIQEMTALETVRTAKELGKAVILQPVEVKSEVTDTPE